MLFTMPPRSRTSPMPEGLKVLVIGTTADYIDWIRKSRPDQAVFVTAPDIRRQARESEPAAFEEVLCDLVNEDAVFQSLAAHLASYGLQPVGVACFDCESLGLAASIAERLTLPFPSPKSIIHCRDKSLSKGLWRKHAVACPDFRLVRSAEDVAAFYRSIEGRCVLKPVSGSGSELVYVCDSEQSCRTNFKVILKELGRRNGNRLYNARNNGGPGILAEECVEGEEYSCDFLLDGDRVDIIRVAHKIKADHKPFGTVRGYILPASLSQAFLSNDLSGTLFRGAAALGLTRSLCMADFIVRNHRIVLLEMTPRPGGDCLPFLLRRSCDLDMLGLAVDFSAGNPISLPDTLNMPPCMGVRIHAERTGTLKHLYAEDLLRDPRVMEGHFPRLSGHKVILPPADYDSWLLGHFLFTPSLGADPISECDILSKKVIVQIEQAPS